MAFPQPQQLRFVPFRHIAPVAVEMAVDNPLPFRLQRVVPKPLRIDDKSWVRESHRFYVTVPETVEKVVRVPVRQIVHNIVDEVFVNSPTAQTFVV